MKDKLLMAKKKMRKRLFFIIVLSSLFILLFACQSAESNKWTPPKFVKEWEIKEIKPGLPHEIISMTANKNGVFVLVKAVETKYSPPKTTKKVTEMTKEEKQSFINKVVMGRLFSGIAVTNMTQIEKDKLISFIIDHFIPPRNSKDMGEKEKDDIIQYLLKLNEEKESERNRNSFKEAMGKKGKEGFIDSIAERIQTSIREEINHFRIQHYDFEGNLIGQWPEDSVVFKKPVRVLSDVSGTILIADYKGSEIIRFDSDGSLIKRLKVPAMDQVGEGFMFSGLTIGKNGHILIIGAGDLLITPKLFEYDPNGKLIKSEELESKMMAYFKLFKNALIPLLMKIERISDIALDNDGNIYMLMYKHLVEKPTVIKLSPSWREEGEFKVILKEGFEVPKMKEYEKYLRRFGGIKKFNSTEWSWVENGPGFYFPSNIFSDGKYIYVMFLGSKPFGVIDAIVYDSKGEMVGYWKQGRRSQMEWFKNLAPDVDVVDTNLSVTQYRASIFIGRTMEVRTGAFYMKSVIQKFTTQGGV